MATLRAYGTPGERAQQTQFWANYYPSNQRANAQFDLSAWSADAAAQQQDFSNRVNLSRFAIGRDDSAQALVEDRRRFDVNAGLSERQLATYGGRERERATAETQARGDEVNAIEFAKQRVAETGDAFEQATKRLETAKSAFDARFNAVTQQLPPGKTKYDRATNTFTPLYPTTDAALLSAIAKANDTLTGHVSEYGLAQQDHKSAADLFQQAQQQLPRGVQVGKQGGKWVINSPTLRRQFSWSPPPPDTSLPTSPPAESVATPDWRDMSMFRSPSPQEVAIGGGRLSAFAPTTETGTALTVPTPLTSNDLVSVFNPAGQPVKIRRSQLTDALAKGYRLR